MKTAVIAIGGNAIEGLLSSDNPGIQAAARDIAGIARLGYRVVVTHGNGPQVGTLLENNEKLSIAEAVSLTQAEIGYVLSGAIERELGRGHGVVVFTRVLVNAKDKAFQQPTKPIGPAYKEKLSSPCVFQPGKGWRRVVASPEPGKIIESKTILSLMKSGLVVIACGGGGMPVVEKNGDFQPVEAVIDKDLAAWRLAELVDADVLLILTDVEYAFLDHGTQSQAPLRVLTTRAAESFLKEGVFAPGSMKEKILASARFVNKDKRRTAIIGKLGLGVSALHGETGTHIVSN